MELNKETREFILNMPKVELHLHLEGAFTYEMLFNLIKKYGGDPSVKSIKDIEQRFAFRDFPHFIETWFWKNRFFREPQDFEESTYFTLKNLHQQNVIYIEAFYSPWDFLPNGLSVADITESTLTAVKRAEKDFGIKCQLIADISREFGWETALDRLNDVVHFRDRGVIGIGLGGSEQKYPPEPFEAVYKAAREQGFHVVAHAGEAAGPESIWAAMQKLNIERIGHGVRAVEDATLVETLKRTQIPLEICVTSNLKTGVYKSIETHPIKYFFDNGLFVTVNSDDPAMFGATITDEFLLLYEKLNFSLKAIKMLTINAVRASFLQESEKQVILNKISNF